MKIKTPGNYRIRKYFVQNTVDSVCPLRDLILEEKRHMCTNQFVSSESSIANNYA